MSRQYPCVERDIFLPESATLVKVQPVTKMETFFECKLDSGKELGHMPGQFVEVSVMGVGEAPISISSSPTQAGTFQLVVRNVGNVTAAMHRMKAGNTLWIRGPFGTHFPVEDGLKGKDILFICGGIGLVPVRSAIQYTLHHRKDYGQIMVLFGTKTPEDRLFSDELESWGKQPGVKCMETVDRGDSVWKGNVGVITTLLPKIQINPERTVAVICGPPIMYKFVIIELRRMKLTDCQIYLSLERRMKCGVGKCGHCQINGLYVCQKGPVFNYADVAGNREAI